MNNPTPPRTMTLDGLNFLERLAAKCESGVIVEVGPLFGSSTIILAQGRQPGTTIHTIDTFENASWVTALTGEDLSRAAFDRYTGHIEDLVVHQGYAPDVVKKTWTEKIGLYFDDATHENPNWLENFDFFSQFFTEDTIMCGDDFATTFPDVVANVYDLTRRFECDLYGMGRVWALTPRRADRIEDAVDEVFPGLSDTSITVQRGGEMHTTKAAVWSAGLHTQVPVDSFRIDSTQLEGDVVLYSGDEEAVRLPIGETVDLRGLDGIRLEARPRARIQYCRLDPDGTTATTAYFGLGGIFRPDPGERIVSIRLAT